MNQPERPINTFYAFCSLILPGLGQLMQKRFGAAAGFFTLFLLCGFLPVLIVSLLFMDRFSYQPLRVHLLHIFAFGGLYFVFLLAVFWSVMDAAKKPGEKQEEKSEETQEEKPSEKKGCSLIAKVVAAIVVVGILVVLLLPAIPAARPAAMRMQCSNNMKQIMLAFHTYHDNYGCFPPAYTVDENGNPLHSWRVLILPYIEQLALYEKIRLDEPWDSEHNSQFHAEVPSGYQCPSAGSLRETPQVPVPTGCFYSVVDGPNAAFYGSQTRSMSEIMLSETVFLVERRTPVNWMDPSREISFETACQGVNVDAMGISSYHSGGANVGLGDGSVDYLSDTIKSEALREMLMLHKNSTPR